jgi:hypothetical protein
VKRLDLIRSIASTARATGLRWTLVRQGSGHEVWDIDGLRVIIPRHRELNERTAGQIMRLLEDKLGPDWWRR